MWVQVSKQTDSAFQCFGLHFSKPMFLLFLRHPKRKILDPNGPYISTSQTKIKNFCLSVILEFCLSLSQSHSLYHAYSSLGRGHIITALSQCDRIFDFRDYFFVQVGNTAICLRKYHENERHLCLTAHIFIKLSQNVKHIWIY